MEIGAPGPGSVGEHGTSAQQQGWEREIKKQDFRTVCPAFKLNDELFTLVVTKLPLQAIFQLRCVCKKWKILLEDHHFLTYFFQQLSRVPLYVVSHDNEFAAFSLEINCWHRWTSALHSKYFSVHNINGDAGDWLFVEEDVQESYGLENLYLTNPTQRVQRKLPRSPEVSEWDPQACGMALGKSSNSCKVFMVNNECPEERMPYGHYFFCRVHLYDSELNSWKAIWSWQTNFDKEVVDSITLYERVLHGIIKQVHRGNGFYFCTNPKVSYFDEQNSRWQELSAQISQELHYEHLFQWQGNLMLVGGRQGEQHQKSRLSDVHIWQLDIKNQVWVESMRMPNHMVDHFYPPEMDLMSREGFFFATCRNYIMLTRDVWIQGTNGPFKKKRHVMCDLSKALWWPVPEPPCSDDNLVVEFSVLIPKFGFKEF